MCTAAATTHVMVYVSLWCTPNCRHVRYSRNLLLSQAEADPVLQPERLESYAAYPRLWLDRLGTCAASLLLCFAPCHQLSLLISIQLPAYSACLCRTLKPVDSTTNHAGRMNRWTLKEQVAGTLFSTRQHTMQNSRGHAVQEGMTCLNSTEDASTRYLRCDMSVHVLVVRMPVAYMKRSSHGCSHELSPEAAL